MFQDSTDLPIHEPDFTGIFEHTLDSKGRVTIPSQYRDKPVNTLYVTKGIDGNLDVYPVPAFSRIYTKFEQMNSADPLTRKLRRLYVAGASKIELDPSGRILIPPKLREFAKISSEVVITGIGDHFEIWSPEDWAKHEAEAESARLDPNSFIHLDL